MSRVIEIGMECPHCEDEFATSRTLDLNQDETSEVVRIDVGMFVEQAELECPECKREFFIGDIPVFIQESGDCDGE